jgi:hypothetical protein
LNREPDWQQVARHGNESWSPKWIFLRPTALMRRPPHMYRASLRWPKGTVAAGTFVAVLPR